MSMIEDLVIAKIKKRADFGLSKYGTDLMRNDLSTLDFLVLAQEEAMDLALYLERLILDEEMSTKQSNTSIQKYESFDLECTQFQFGAENEI